MCPISSGTDVLDKAVMCCLYELKGSSSFFPPPNFPNLLFTKALGVKQSLSSPFYCAGGVKNCICAFLPQKYLEIKTLSK